jgi:hypothetical protein
MLQCQLKNLEARRLDTCAPDDNSVCSGSNVITGEVGMGIVAVIPTFEECDAEFC